MIRQSKRQQAIEITHRLLGERWFADTSGLQSAGIWPYLVIRSSGDIFHINLKGETMNAASWWETHKNDYVPILKPEGFK